MTVLRALGVESEAELEFSGLLEALRPLVGGIDQLPRRQADALRSALGMSRGGEVDRFAIGAATLSLVATAAESRLFSCWSMTRSGSTAPRQTRSFSPRAGSTPTRSGRSSSEGVGDGFQARGLVDIQLEGLGPDASRSLLAAGAPVAVAPRWRRDRGGDGREPARPHRGARLLTRDQLTGEEPLEDPLPAGATLERIFERRLAALPEDTRRALLVAAVGRRTSSS